MKEYIIYLKSGASFTIRCKEFKIIYSSITGEAIAYEYKGAINIPIYININDISAVIQKEVD